MPRIARTGEGTEKVLIDSIAQNPEILTLDAVRINLRSLVFPKFHPLLKLIPNIAYGFISFIFISSLWTHWAT